MTMENKTTLDTVTTARIPSLDQPVRSSALKVGRFTLHLLEMLLSMAAGMPIFFFLEGLVPTNSGFAPFFASGTELYDTAHAVFMTVPMVTWMILRGHGFRHSAEMAFAMLAPVAAGIALSLLGAEQYLPWIEDASHMAMFLGMLIAMLYRRDHYMGKAGRSGHAAHH